MRPCTGSTALAISRIRRAALCPHRRRDDWRHISSGRSAPGISRRAPTWRISVPSSRAGRATPGLHWDGRRASADCWLIYFGDVHVGTIAKSVGNPNATPQWKWQCGFYVGSDPGGEQRGGTAGDFEQARHNFEAAGASSRPGAEAGLSSAGLLATLTLRKELPTPWDIPVMHSTPR
jgi:hypothetical protein